MERRLLNPKIDFVFKKIFGSEKHPGVLISFLNAVLKPKNNITDVEIKNTDIDKSYIEDKFSRLDVKAVTSKNEIINIEIQLKNEYNMIQRSLYYWSKLYEEQLLISEPFVEYEFGDNFAHIAITGQSKNPELVLKEIQEEINNLKQDGLDEEHFNRIKNMLYGTAVKEFNNVSDIVRMFVSDYFKGINSFDYLETYKQITKEYAKQILNNVFKEENTIISVVEPKDKTN